MQHKRGMIITAIVIAITMAVPASAAVPSQSIMIPAYKYPTTWQPDAYWDTLVAAGGAKVPLVIINPDSGPGIAQNGDYQEQMRRNKAAGIRQIGYVHTLYQQRPIAEVKQEIDDWYRLYPDVQGIFLDEIAIDSDRLCYLSQLYNYIKQRSPQQLVVINPGRHIPDVMANYADIMVTYETNGNKYINDYVPATSTFETTEANHGRIAHIVHDVTPGDYAQVLALSRDRNVGWLFITDDVMPNPYDVLPTNFNQFAQDVTALPAVQVVPRDRQPALPGCADPHALAATTPGPVVSTPPAAPAQPTRPSTTVPSAPNTGRQQQLASMILPLSSGAAVVAAALWVARRK